MARLKLRRGNRANLPTSGLLEGEPLWSSDRGNLHVATGEDASMTVAPAVEDLPAVASVDGAADLLMLHDADASGRKERRITVDAFKASLAIPEGSTDELVAVVSGGTPGYVWGTDGTDGVLRMGAGMGWSKDGGNGFVTLAVDVVDGGTFV